MRHLSRLLRRWQLHKFKHFEVRRNDVIKSSVTTKIVFFVLVAGCPANLAQSEDSLARPCAR